MIRVGLSTSSVYPSRVATAFEMAGRLGYDGVEIMVFTDPASQQSGPLQALSDLHGMPVLAIHAPTLLLTQGIWGNDPWGKVDRAIELAQQVEAPTIVVHPPFRWQAGYAEGFVEGVAWREQASGIRIAVENMFPWRIGRREVKAYSPGWDPRPHPYASVCIDFSHCATANVDAMTMLRDVQDRLAHFHLADGLGSFKDEHLVPGRGSQPCAEALRHLAATGWSGDVVVEVGTRKLAPLDREAELRESLRFAREHLGQTSDAA